jgi:heptaprenyl diphosphate synthase
VEQALLDATQSEASFVTQAAQHVMVAGGKRFRPLLVLLAAEFGPGPTVTVPSVLTAVTIAMGVAATLVLGIVPGPVLDLAAHAGEFIR